MPRRSRRDATTSTILAAFDQDLLLYSTYTGTISALVAQLLEANGIPVHSVTARVKQRASLERKLAKPTAQYRALADVTDLCGIRVTTYFEDAVDKVAALIDREFTIDRVNSIDKRALLDPDRFGYLSLHYVVSLSPERSALAEYRRYDGYKAEIQIRSILQHAWAEIEHDLGYKTNLALPAEVRRRFARLAGLLELADKEFTGIRQQLEDYQAAVPGQIENRPGQVGIDKASLDAFVRTDSIASRLDREIVRTIGATLVDDDRDFLQDDPAMLLSLGITTIEDLRRTLQDKERLIAEYAGEWLRRGEQQHKSLNRGISLFYLWYVSIASSGDVDRIAAVLRDQSIGPGAPDEIARDVLTTYETALRKASGSAR